MKSRIVIICSEYPFFSGETFLINELSYLKQKFDEVVLFPLDVSPNQTNQSDIKVLLLDRQSVAVKEILCALKSRTVLTEMLTIFLGFEKMILRFKIAIRSWIQAMRIARILQELPSNPNTVYYSYWGIDGAIALAYFKQLQPEMKVASRFHGWDVFKFANSINYLPFRTFIAARIPHLFPISNAGKIEIEKWNPQKTPSVYYLGAENPLKQFNPISTEIVILSLSNFNAVKRIPLFFEVLSHLKIALRWIHIGGADSYVELVENGKKLLPANIHFEWKGSMTHDEVLRFFSQQPITCLLNLSASEGIPVSMMEAMSYGIPVFATNVGGVSEIVDEHCGVLINKDLPAHKIAAKLEEFLHTDLLSFRVAARNKWLESFNAEVNYSVFAHHLKSFLNE